MFQYTRESAGPALWSADWHVVLIPVLCVMSDGSLCVDFPAEMLHGKKVTRIVQC